MSDKQKPDDISKSDHPPTAIPRTIKKSVELPRSLDLLLSSHSRQREPVTRSKGRVVGKLASKKNNRCIHWESQLECKAIYLLEFSLGVIAYHEQPKTFVITHNGKKFKYTPDFCVTFANGSHAYIEVKPLSRVLSKRIKERLTIAADHISSHGSELMVMTEVEIEKFLLLDNIRQLKPYAALPLSDDLVSTVKLRLAKDKSQVSYSTFLSWFEDMKYALACLAQFIVIIDLNQSLSNNNFVRLPEETDNENCLFHYRIAPLFE